MHQVGAHVSDAKHRPGDRLTKSDFAECRQFGQYCDFAVIGGPPASITEQIDGKTRKRKLVRWDCVKERESEGARPRIVEIGDWMLTDRTTEYRIERREIVPADSVNDQAEPKKRKGGRNV